MAQQFVQVPPNSTGTKVGTVERTVLRYDNYTGNIQRGDVVAGATTGASGRVTANVVDSSGTSGELYIENVTGTFQNDENINVDAAPQAVVKFDVSTEQFTFANQTFILADPENPSYQQRIDKFGATVNTFSDGSPIFEAFGGLTVAENTPIRAYQFTYDEEPGNFYNEMSGAGSCEFEVNSGCDLLTVTNAAGDLAKRTSHFYHPYTPGSGQLIEMSMRVGDTGKANNVRRWGYYDDNNGAFWELDGTTLYVVLRSNVSGSVTERRVAQADFNQSNLQGANAEDFTLDLTGGNIFTIDFQWLGTGRVKFGCVDENGKQVAAHIFQNVGSQTVVFPYMRTATLPVRWENFNTGATASSTELRANCISVKRALGTNQIRGKQKHDWVRKTGLAPAAGEVPVISVRPKTTFKGAANRTVAYPTEIKYTNRGDSLVHFRIYATTTDLALTGEAFADINADVAVETDKTATAFNPAFAQLVTSRFILPNESYSAQIEPNVNSSFAIFMQADGVTQPHLIITAEALDGTSSDIMVEANWEQVEE